MKEEKDTLASYFRQQLGELEITPPDKVWEGVATKIQRKRRLIIYRYVAVAAMFALFAGLAFLLQERETVMNGVATHQEVTPVHPKIETLAQEAIISEIMDDHSLALNVSTKNTLTSHNNANTQTPNNTQQIAEDEAANEILPEIVTPSIMIAEASENQEESATKALAVDDEALALELLQQHLDRLKTELAFDNTAARMENSLALSLSFNSIPTSIGSKPELLVGSSSVRYGPDPFQSDIGYETSYFEEIESTVLQPPVSIGLKLAYYLSSRWSLETGIQYTDIITASKTVELDNNYNRYEQALAYIGIPLGVRYELIQRKAFQIYLGQSVMIEKGIRATNRTLRYEEGSLASINRDFAPIAGMQLSSFSAAGINLPIYGRFSFYGEGGLQVFYLNATQPFNIRSAKQLWPALHGGFRIKL